MNALQSQVRRFACRVVILLSLMAVLPLAGAAQGNSVAAHACQGDGYKTLVGINGETFANTGECVRFAAHGGLFADGTDVLEGNIVVPAGYSVAFTSTLEACNALEFGYWASDGSGAVLDSIPADGCPGTVDTSVLSGSIGPFPTDVVLTVYLTDVTCGVTYDSEAASNGHVALAANAPSYRLYFADAGSGCGRSGVITTFLLPGNLSISLEVHE
jgi:hypothetical protein